MTKRKEYKKIFYRFLKECKLFVAWNEYVRKEKFTYNWNNSTYIDSILKESYFGIFMEEKKHIPLSDKLGKMFRYYVITKYGEKYPVSRPISETPMHFDDKTDVIIGVFEKDMYDGEDF